MKRIVILKADGGEKILDKFPTLKEMQAAVGGYIEHISVVDRVQNGKMVFTSMYVNEEGLLLGLPVNQRATEIYQRCVRLQYPLEPYPFRKAKEEFRKSLGDDVALIEAIPEEAKSLGYEDNPFICGDVLYFEGYDEEELEKLFGE